MPGLGKRQRQVLLTLYDGRKRHVGEFGESDPYPLNGIYMALKSLVGKGWVVCDDIHHQGYDLPEENRELNYEMLEAESTNGDDSILRGIDFSKLEYDPSPNRTHGYYYSLTDKGKVVAAKLYAQVLAKRVVGQSGQSETRG